MSYALLHLRSACQVQDRREGGPDYPGRVQAGPAHGGQVQRHHAQG